jgi:hypothetical protein
MNNKIHKKNKLQKYQHQIFMHKKQPSPKILMFGTKHKKNIPRNLIQKRRKLASSKCQGLPAYQICRRNHQKPLLCPGSLCTAQVQVSQLCSSAKFKKAYATGYIFFAIHTSYLQSKKQKKTVQTEHRLDSTN